MSILAAPVFPCPVTINGQDYISYAAAAEMCRCGRTRIQAAVRAGAISTVRPGRYKLLCLRDVEAWLAGQVTISHRPVGRPRVR